MNYAYFLHPGMLVEMKSLKEPVSLNINEYYLLVEPAKMYFLNLFQYVNIVAAFNYRYIIIIINFISSSFFM
jgi:hypothetical protein